MSELRNEPTPSDLLDRIAQLESKLATLQRRCDFELPALKAQVADLLAAFKFQVDASGKEILRIHDFLWPLVYKVFPGFLEDKTHADKIMSPCSPEGQADRRQEDKSK